MIQQNMDLLLYFVLWCTLRIQKNVNKKNKYTTTELVYEVNNLLVN